MIRFHKRYLKQRIEQMAGTRKQQHGVIEAKSDVGDACIGQHIKALIISCYFVPSDSHMCSHFGLLYPFRGTSRAHCDASEVISLIVRSAG
jgi:hypothetical protein